MTDEIKTPTPRTRMVNPQLASKMWVSEGSNPSIKGLAVRLPEGVTLNDVGNDPNIWKQLQTMADGHRRSLNKFDHVFAIAHDESWVATAIVAHVSGTQVYFTNVKKIATTAVESVPFEDENYRAEWRNGQFRAIRKTDGTDMGVGAATVAGIKIEIAQNLYPKKVAA
jgi:hypothetical protein